jgi:glycosyltransferase involved in cell wall biosynthesis
VSSLFVNYGGVSDYTDNLARQLHRRGRLKAVVTPFYSNVRRDYDIRLFEMNLFRKPRSTDRWKIVSKVMTLFYYIRLYASAYRAMKKLKLQNEKDLILFTEYYTFQFDIIIFFARLLNIRYGLVFHGLDLICEKNSRFTHFKRNFSKAEFIVYNSEATRVLAAKLLGLEHANTAILYPGVDVAKLERAIDPGGCSCKFRDRPETVVFATVSRLVKRKGIDLAIRMVHELAKAGIPLHYYIAGMGEERRSLETLIGELDAAQYITLLGDIGNEEKYALLQASDIFLFPNNSAGKNDFEGFGISCIEASFFGNVIIGGNHGGVKEAVLDQQTGFLFDFDDPASVDRAILGIRSCLENPELREKIRKQGMEYVRSTYDWNRLVDRFIKTEQTFFPI